MVSVNAQRKAERENATHKSGVSASGTKHVKVEEGSQNPNNPGAYPDSCIPKIVIKLLQPRVCIRRRRNRNKFGHNGRWLQRRINLVVHLKERVERHRAMCRPRYTVNVHLERRETYG